MGLRMANIKKFGSESCGVWDKKNERERENWSPGKDLKRGEWLDIEDECKETNQWYEVIRRR